ncbi:hypothetical protein BTO10_00845 [Vibrio chagasii]|uniref:Uncharacterized protein n=1 Tax=Vibrio chagasii TaxID=170679 RepID=A0A2S7VMK5_9VIBR|nr:hypothetical protein [Vibrio chagasii]PQJ63396.1 hypothetical protein BTO10_00845 [Vibrio chagasii]
MEFNEQNYQTIKRSCLQKQNITFYAPKEFTCFANDEAPSSWRAYPPTSLADEAYEQIFVCTGEDARGTLTKLELTIHLDGGRILYRRRDDEYVELQVTFNTH